MSARATLRWFECVSVSYTDGSPSRAVRLNAPSEGMTAGIEQAYVRVNGKLPDLNDLFTPDVDG